MNTMKDALEVAGSIGYPSKMPGTSYGISATMCKVGAKLAKIEGSTCSGCYALKGHYRHASVTQAHAKRLDGISDPNWANAMVYMLRRAHGLDGGKVSATVKSPGYHRWHDSGDLQSLDHLDAICDVARRTPELKHWLPTREASMVAAYGKSGGSFPANLTVRVSATMVDGAPSRAFANTSTVHRINAAIGHACPAPTQGNECGSCRACWSTSVANVSYHIH